MDVQDLILKWIFERSYCARPQLALELAKLLRKVIGRYQGGNIFLDCETEVLVWSSLQMYIYLQKYDQEFMETFIMEVGAQVGQSVMLTNLMRVYVDDRVITNFHSEDILDILTKMIGFQGSLSPDFYNPNFIHIFEQICYDDKDRSLQLKAIGLVKWIFEANPQVSFLCGLILFRGSPVIWQTSKRDLNWCSTSRAF
jgi:hypothetical protein